MGLKLKELRQSAGVSQIQLCRRVPGLSRFKLSLAENDLCDLTPATLELIHNALKNLVDEKHQNLKIKFEEELTHIKGVAMK